MNTPKVKPGVVSGDDLQALFALAKAGRFALPAINVINTSTVNAVLETAAELKSPAILQFSNGGAQFYAGKALNNDAQRACIAGAVSAAHHVHAMAEHGNRVPRRRHLRQPRTNHPHRPHMRPGGGSITHIDSNPVGRNPGRFQPSRGLPMGRF